MLAEMRGIGICTPVWGPQYLKYFVDYSLPTLLTAGNIPALTNRFHVEYMIYTDADGKSFLENSLSFQRLREMCNVSFKMIELEGGIDVYISGSEQNMQIPGFLPHHLLMSSFYSWFIEYCHVRNLGCLPINADGFWSQNCLSVVADAISEGNNIVSRLGITAELDPFIRDAERFRVGDCIDVSVEELIDLGMKHLHPWTKSFLIDSPVFNDTPSMLLWKCGNGVVARTHLIDVLFFFFGRRSLNHEFSTIDLQFIVNNVDERDRIRFLDARDDFSVWEISAVKSGSKVGYDVPNMFDEGAVVLALGDSNFPEKAFANLRQPLVLASRYAENELADVLDESAVTAEILIELRRAYLAAFGMRPG